MRLISDQNDLCLIRFDRGEEVVSELSTFCAERKIQSASFTAIGAARRVVLAYYNLSEKKYEDHAVAEETEIVSVIGNVARMNKDTLIHAHGVFAKRDLTTIGGHIKKLVVSATCEVTLRKLGNLPILRQFDDKTGLNLLS